MTPGVNSAVSAAELPMRPVHAFLAALLLLLAACAEPIPESRAEYVGHWQASNMRLTITAGGEVSYERRDGGVSRTINAPLQGFEGDNFVVGFGPFNTTFVVSRPPHLDNGLWKMTVDGVELVRGASGPGDHRA